MEPCTPTLPITRTWHNEHALDDTSLGFGGFDNWIPPSFDRQTLLQLDPSTGSSDSEERQSDFPYVLSWPPAHNITRVTDLRQLQLVASPSSISGLPKSHVLVGRSAISRENFSIKFESVPFGPSNDAAHGTFRLTVQLKLWSEDYKVLGFCPISGIVLCLLDPNNFELAWVALASLDISSGGVLSLFISGFRVSANFIHKGVVK